MPRLTFPRLAAVVSLLFSLVHFSIEARAAESEPPEPRSAREISFSTAAPFSLPPADLLAWGGSVRAGEGDDVIVLLNEEKVRIEEDGRQTVIRRLVYAPQTQGGAEGWAPVEAYWSPWNQERPEIRARVVTRDGVEHQFDPSTIDDAPATDGSATIFSDRRVLRAPLPAVAPGAVVEQYIVTRDKTPLFDAGMSVIHQFEWGAPVRLSVFEVDAPSVTPLEFATRRTDVQATRETAGGRVRVRYEAGPFAAIEKYESGVPSDIAQVATVSVATGASWNAVATRYHQIVEKQIASADVARLVADAIGKETSRSAIIAKLVSRLHRDVRYTGVEFAEASIVPRTPKETLTRRFGDCKDKAALLVAMLGHAGIAADIALLRTGPGRDIEPEIHGFGRFDHAIVYVPGDPPVWIDATDELGRIDTLPLPSQGRLALIASPKTTSLVKTPESRSEDNRRVEFREFRLAELGKATVIERTETHGSIERNYRSSYDSNDKKTVREWLEDYARDSYLSEKLASYSHTEPRDLSKPFELRVELHEAGRGASDLAESVVVIFPGRIMDKLPSEFTEADEKDSTGKVKKKDPRKYDYVFYEPFVVEWNYKIIAPPGFRTRSLPESETVSIGSATLLKEFHQENDQIVTAKLRFDSGKRHLTISEYESMRAAVLDAQNMEMIVVAFDQIGYAALQRGEIREALDEFRKLVGEHPKEGLHHAQVALALLEAGLGEAARTEIEKAVKTDAKSAIAQTLRGWIYQHDRFGRRFKRGFDLERAVASYRKAKELDPSDVTTRANLAILLEHDAHGERYSAKAKLAEAIAEYEAIRADLQDDSFVENELVALLRANRFDALKALVDEKTNVAQRREYLLLIDIAKSGTNDVGRLAAKHIFDLQQRRTALQSVAESFVQIRRYPEAVACLLEAAKGSPDATQLRARADLLRKASRHEDAVFPDSDPTSIVKQSLRLLLGPDVSADVASPLMASHIREQLRDKDFRREFESRLLVERNAALASGVSAEVLLDVIFAMLQFSVDGSDDVGYRIRLQGFTSSGASDEAVYVVKEDNHYRIAKTEGSLYGLAVCAKNRLAKKDLDGARKWLDWAREESAERMGDDPMTGRPIVYFWKKGQTATEKAIDEAIAALLIEGPREAVLEAVAVLRKGAEEASSDAERLKYDVALAAAYGELKDGAGLLPVAERIADGAPDADGPLLARSAALLLLKRHADVIAIARERLENDPTNSIGLRVLADVYAKTGKFDEAIRLYRQIIETGKGTAIDYNNIAWYGLSAPTVTQQAVEDAQKAVAMSSNASSAIHTLATLYAEQGKTSEAKAAIWQAIEAAGAREPRSHDAYVLGRIAEEYGIRDAAIAAYRKVEKASEVEENELSPWSLAQKRLKGLGAK